MTSLLRRKRPITPRSTGKSTISVLGAALAVALALGAVQIIYSPAALASESSSDDAMSTNHDNKLRWQPYRPDHSISQSKNAGCKDSVCKDSGCKDAACKDADAPSHSATEPSSCTVKRVHRAAAETASLPSKVRLAADEESESAPALNDPFGDTPPPTSYQRRIAITADDNEPLQVPPRETPRQMHISSGRPQQAPAEFQTSEPLPLRRGPGHSVKVYQPAGPSPGPEPYSSESTPNFDAPLNRALQNPTEDCRTAYDELKGNTLDKVSLDIKEAGQPGNDIPYECSLTTDQFSPRSWQLTTYTWKSSSLCHKPLYFEEEALERYGHSHGWICEDLVSCAHFFGNVCLLPYHVGVETPCECIYDLGVYRVGDCAPYTLDPFPLSVRGACTAAVGYGAVIALFP